jgi:hypothetical protein
LSGKVIAASVLAALGAWKIASNPEDSFAATVANGSTLTVEPAGNLYRFVWSNNTDGVGIRQGNNVAVGIGGARCGFVAYEIKSDGTLDGIWGGYGSDKTGTEKATRQ